MDALIAKADALGPRPKKRKITHDSTEDTVKKRTAVPKSLQDKGLVLKDVPQHKHIANKKLRTELTRTATQTARAKALLQDAEMLLTEDAGLMQAEGDLERTWRVSQSEILDSAGQDAARGRREWKLDGGPYRSRYTRNGRSVATKNN
jgi:U3 small nucleolar RNA-associated protein 7